MDEGSTTVRNRTPSQPGAPPPPAAGTEPPPGDGELSPARSRRSLRPHHRRRRASALIVILAVISLIAGISLGAGGGGSVVHPARHAIGFFTRIRLLAGRGSGSFSLAEQVVETGAINRTLKYTPYVRIAGAQHRELALTFDDGPGPYTPLVLSVLGRNQVPATFFEVGSLENYFHAGTSQVLADGDVIGDHTESHAPMSQLSGRDQKSQLLSQTSAAGAWGAPFPRLFRPPYGLWDHTTLRLLHRYRMLMVLWTVDTGDYRRPGVDAIINSVVSGARPGAIVLMHDGGGDRQQTVAALPRIINKLRARGYKLVTVPRLLLDNPAPKDQQISSVFASGGG